MKGKYGAQTKHRADFNINFAGGETYVGVEELFYNDVTYYLIDNEGFFGDAVYRGGLAEGEQYAFFCRAVIEAASRIGFIPDVIHCNDWQTADPNLTSYTVRTLGYWKCENDLYDSQHDVSGRVWI